MESEPARSRDRFERGSSERMGFECSALCSRKILLTVSDLVGSQTRQVKAWGFDFSIFRHGPVARQECTSLARSVYEGSIPFRSTKWQ